MNGIINVLKPSEMTSHDVVSFIRKNFNIKKVGHTGTLDPNAAGVLPICIGKATRVAEYFNDFNKSYRCELTLGASTDTQDKYGNILETSDKQVTESQIIKVFNEFRGNMKQTPPMYSAIKHKGKKLYELAREGKIIERKQRDITIYNIEILRNYENKRILFDVDCSKGTYVRTICNDVGERLGTFAHMSFLMRTKVGNFSIREAYTLDEIEKLKEKDILDTALLPLDTSLLQYSSIKFSESYSKRLKNGLKLKIDNKDESYKANEQVRVYGVNEFIGVGIIEYSDNEWYLKMKKVLA